jgi:hypothetical protein
VELVLSLDVVDRVVGQIQVVGMRLRRRVLERAVRVCEAIEVVVDEVLVGRPAEYVRRATRGRSRRLLGDFGSAGMVLGPRPSPGG